MSNSKSWVLPSGHTFLGMTLGMFGSWAKAADPVSAAIEAARSQSNNCDYPAAVFMIEDGKVDVTDGFSAGLQWQDGSTPVPLGLFKVHVHEPDDMRWDEDPTYSVTPHEDEEYGHEQFMAHWLPQTIDKTN